MKLLLVFGVVAVLGLALASTPNVVRAASTTTTECMFNGSSDLRPQTLGEAVSRECSSRRLYSIGDVQQSSSYRLVGVWGEVGKRQPPPPPPPQGQQSNQPRKQTVTMTLIGTWGEINPPKS